MSRLIHVDVVISLTSEWPLALQSVSPRPTPRRRARRQRPAAHSAAPRRRPSQPTSVALDALLEAALLSPCPEASLPQPAPSSAALSAASPLPLAPASPSLAAWPARARRAPRAPRPACQLRSAQTPGCSSGLWWSACCGPPPLCCGPPPHPAGRTPLPGPASRAAPRLEALATAVHLAGSAPSGRSRGRAGPPRAALARAPKGSPASRPTFVCPQPTSPRPPEALPPGTAAPTPTAVATISGPRSWKGRRQ